MSGESEREREFSQREASCQTVVVGELWRRKSVGCCTWTRKAGALTVNPVAKLPNLLPGVVLCCTTEVNSQLLSVRSKKSCLFLLPLRWDSCFLSRTLSVTHPARSFAMEVLTDRVLEIARGEAGEDI